MRAVVQEKSPPTIAQKMREVCQRPVDLKKELRGRDLFPQRNLPSPSNKTEACWLFEMRGAPDYFERDCPELQGKDEVNKGQETKARPKRTREAALVHHSHLDSEPRPVHCRPARGSRSGR